MKGPFDELRKLFVRERFCVDQAADAKSYRKDVDFPDLTDLQVFYELWLITDSVFIHLFVWNTFHCHFCITGAVFLLYEPVIGFIELGLPVSVRMLPAVFDAAIRNVDFTAFYVD